MVLKKAKKKVLLFPKGQFNVRIVYSTRVIKVFHATTILCLYLHFIVLYQLPDIPVYHNPYELRLVITYWYCTIFNLNACFTIFVLIQQLGIYCKKFKKYIYFLVYFHPTSTVRSDIKQSKT